MREGSPRIVFATALMRAAFSGDLELVKLLLAHGADPHIRVQGQGDVADGSLRNRLHQRLSQTKNCRPKGWTWLNCWSIWART